MHPPGRKNRKERRCISHKLTILLGLCLVSTPWRPTSVHGYSPKLNFPSSFEFAPNGVCLKPRFFFERIPSTVVGAAGSGERDSSVIPAEATEGEVQTFTMKTVPGDGDCVFLAVALATATSMGLGGNDALLRAISRETREVVAQVMESPDGQLYVAEGYPNVTSRALLTSATKEVGLKSNQEYLRLLRLEGRAGGLYGGGPELTVLANVLRRPISIYEVSQQTISQSDSSTVEIVKKGTFGKGLFEDPCLDIPNSAVLSGLQTGAYSWHLHILILDVSPIEKHACVLLPYA